MADEQDQQKLERLDRYYQWAIVLAMVAVLGSCVAQIGGVGGGHDSNQKMVGIFFFYLLVVVPCVFGLFIFVRIKIEKRLLKRDAAENMNKAHIDLAENKAKRNFGSLHDLLKRFWKK